MRTPSRPKTLSRLLHRLAGHDHPRRRLLPGLLLLLCHPVDGVGPGAHPFSLASVACWIDHLCHPFGHLGFFPKTLSRLLHRLAGHDHPRRRLLPGLLLLLCHPVDGVGPGAHPFSLASVACWIDHLCHPFGHLGFFPKTLSRLLHRLAGHDHPRRRLLPGLLLLLCHPVDGVGPGAHPYFPAIGGFGSVTFASAIILAIALAGLLGRQHRPATPFHNACCMPR